MTCIRLTPKYAFAFNVSCYRTVDPALWTWSRRRIHRQWSCNRCSDFQSVVLYTSQIMFGENQSTDLHNLFPFRLESIHVRVVGASSFCFLNMTSCPQRPMHLHQSNHRIKFLLPEHNISCVPLDVTHHCDFCIRNTCCQKGLPGQCPGMLVVCLSITHPGLIHLWGETAHVDFLPGKFNPVGNPAGPAGYFCADFSHFSPKMNENWPKSHENIDSGRKL